MKKFVAVLLISMLALTSIPVMADESVTKGPPVMATVTAGVTLPVSLSVDSAPLVKAIEALAISVSFGFLVLVLVMICICVALYFNARPMALLTEIHTSPEPADTLAKKAGSVQPEIPRKTRKSGSKKQATTPVA